MRDTISRPDQVPADKEKIFQLFFEIVRYEDRVFVEIAHRISIIDDKIRSDLIKQPNSPLALYGRQVLEHMERIRQIRLNEAARPITK